MGISKELEFFIYLISKILINAIVMSFEQLVQIGQYADRTLKA